MLRHPSELPRTDALLDQAGCGDAPRAVVVAAVRSVVQAARARLLAGEVVDGDGLVPAIRDAVRRALTPSLRPVINATGVVLHTNLGRAPWSDAAIAAAGAVARSYANLELRLADGARGGRGEGAASLLASLCGAEDALVVNNGAAALLLALTALAQGKQVVVSRGELVEIGGSFRVPDIITACGAQLAEVGTTNRTRASDLVRAISPDTAVILLVHPSNFHVTGFTERVPTADAARVAAEHGLVSVYDTGSGSLDGVGEEPGIRPAIAAGIDLVTCSGDKLLGGPQSGLIVGRSALIRRLRAHPLYRALRVDKVTLAALEATLQGWRDDELPPVAQMMRVTPGELEARAVGVAARLVAAGVAADVVPASGFVGGGSLPGEGLPSFAVRVRHGAPNGLADRLRDPAAGVPVISRVAQDALLLDVRTVRADEEEALVAAVVAALAR